MRERFHVPDHYFLSHSVGCLPRATPDQLTEAYFAPWRDRGGEAWPGWMDGLDRFRDLIGELFGTVAHNICPQTNVSSALTKIIHALPAPGSRQTILCTEADFPTIGFVLKQAERAGYSVRFVTGDVSDPNAWLDAWDDSVGLVHITHAFSNTSKLSPVAKLCELARTRGAVSIVDIAQSAGIVPINLPRWEPDFAIGTGVKFLCAGPGACYLYASNAMIESCQPIDVGWFSHEAPFEMDIHDFRYASSAMRFFGGTPSPAPFAMACAALELWREIGIEHAQERAQTLLSRLIEHVPERMLVSPSIAGDRGGTLVVHPDDREALARTLTKAGIRHDERREGFRFSVHGYSSDEDVDHLGDVLRTAL